MVRALYMANRIDYISLLDGKKAERPLKIPCNLSEKILKDRENLRSVVLWLELKPLFYNGEFKNACSRSADIANYLRVSKRKYLYVIKRLEKIGFLRFEGKNMILCSWKTFFEFYGINRETKRYKFYRLKNIYANSEYLLRRFAIDENFKRQAFAIETKIFNKNSVEDRQIDLLKDLNKVRQSLGIAKEDRQRLEADLLMKIEQVGSLDPKHAKREKRKLRKAGVLQDWTRREERAYFKNRGELNYFYPINFDISISCKRLAEIYGLKSSSGGFYWQNLLQIGKFIEIHSRAILLNDNSQNSSRFYREMKNGDSLGHQFEGKSGIFKRLNNSFTLLPLESF